AGDYQPADGDAEILHVSDQYLQHLSNPAAGGGRVDVPDGAPGQEPPNPVSGLDQAQVPLAADDGLQQRHRPPWHFYGLDQAHRIHLPFGRGLSLLTSNTSTRTACDGVSVGCPFSAATAHNLPVRP